MGRHLLLVGGGHAHMVTLANIYRFIEMGHNVTVIGPSEYHYYSGMGPGMLGKAYRPEEIRFATKHVVQKQGGRFILGKASRVDPEGKRVFLDSGESISYDIVSFNSGSHVPTPPVTGDTENIFSVKPIERLIDAQNRVLELIHREKITIGIVGGGPSAAEIAGNTWQLTQDNPKGTPTILIFSGNRFMSRYPENIRKKVVKSLTGRGIEILESGYVGKIDGGRIELESGESYDTDFVFLALGVQPSPMFKRSDLPTGPDGGLLVNRYLQSVAYPEIFGGGDCIYFQPQPLDKVGVYAVRENPIIYHNLMASLAGEELQPFDPGGDYLLIFNLGGGKAVLRKKWIMFGGKAAFIFKDYIDRKFIKKFQAIEGDKL